MAVRGKVGGDEFFLIFLFFLGIFFYHPSPLTLCPLPLRALFSAAGEKAPANRFFVSGLRIKLSRGLLQPQILHGFLVWIAESKSVARELSSHTNFITQFQANAMVSSGWDGNARRRELEVSTCRSASISLSRQCAWLR